MEEDGRRKKKGRTKEGRKTGRKNGEEGRKKEEEIK